MQKIQRAQRPHKDTQKYFLLVCSLIVILLAGCQDDLVPKKLTSEEQAELAAQDNAQTILATQEALDVTAGAMEDKGVAEGRVKHGDHDNYGCAPAVNLNISIDRNHNDSIVYKGTISVNYGDGSTCDSKNRRTGKITDDFTIVVSTKNKVRFSMTETLTFEAFTRDSTTYNGVIIVGSANGKKTTVEGNNVAISYTDGTTSRWKGILNFAYEDLSKRKGEIRVTGNISGTSRQNVSYTATITEEVLFKTGCFGWIKKIPVDGAMSVSTNGSTSTLDFGSGTCDRIYTVNVNGETTQHVFD
ncbi:MAG TPA: hypothetical protein VFE50_22560 [Cyclobacteriaceae bacterium]|nr:hypothetical protein [Cyclobacteriaceae bacterium]